MNEQEKIISEANKYVMPAVEDYLAARCLLLNGIFVGLTLAHEATEKMTKALLILEKVSPPDKSHNLEKLTKKLISKNSAKYAFLKTDEDFVKRLDKHYGWRYYDGDIRKRSQSKSPQDLYPFDDLLIALYKQYMTFLETNSTHLFSQFRTYLFPYLFDENMKKYTNWSEILIEDNQAILKDLDLWEREYKKIFKKNVM